MKVRIMQHFKKLSLCAIIIACHGTNLSASNNYPPRKQEWRSASNISELCRADWHRHLDQQKTAKIQSDVLQIQTDVSQIKTDMTQVKSDVIEMKSLFGIMVGTMQLQLQASLQLQQNQIMTIPPYYPQPIQQTWPDQAPQTTPIIASQKIFSDGVTQTSEPVINSEKSQQLLSFLHTQPKANPETVQPTALQNISLPAA